MHIPLSIGSSAETNPRNKFLRNDTRIFLNIMRLDCFHKYFQQMYYVQKLNILKTIYTYKVFLKCIGKMFFDFRVVMHHVNKQYYLQVEYNRNDLIFEDQKVILRLCSLIIVHEYLVIVMVRHYHILQTWHSITSPIFKTIKKKKR